MDSTLNETRVISTRGMVEPVEVSEGMRIARYCALDELPGLAFGIMTIIYIVLSLAGLA